MATVAFLGLGIMGRPMARNCARAGHRVRGYNRTLGRAAELVAAGGTEARSVAEAVAEADVVMTALTDGAVVQELLLADGGVADAAAPGTVVVDFSTIAPHEARDLHRRLAERGLAFLDAPVSGGQPGAEAGALSIMVGGDVEGFTRAAPVLEAVGRTVVHVGGPGAGQTVKAANQLMVAGHLGLLAEALVFLEAQGVALGPAVDVLGGGLAGSAVLDQKARRMLDRSFEPGGRLDLHHKDMGILLAAAREVGVATPLGALAAQLVAAARAQGDGELDHAVLFRVIEQLSGRG